MQKVADQTGHHLEKLLAAIKVFHNDQMMKTNKPKQSKKLDNKTEKRQSNI